MIGTGVLVEKVISILAKQFKLDKVLDYVENPNEADKEIKNLRARVESLEKMAHTQRDFVICNQCKKQIEEL